MQAYVVLKVIGKCEQGYNLIVDFLVKQKLDCEITHSKSFETVVIVGLKDALAKIVFFVRSRHFDSDDALVVYEGS